VNLYTIGGQTFAGKCRQGLGVMLRRFQPAEIERAYQEFVSPLDDFEMKHAAKNFCEGGAESIIGAMRERERKEREQRFQMEHADAEVHAKANQELAEIRQRRAEEDALALGACPRIGSC
jgi:hypothetical protein